MNVAELQQFLADLPGDTPVLVMEADSICPRDAVPRVVMVAYKMAVLL